MPNPLPFTSPQEAGLDPAATRDITAYLDGEVAAGRIAGAVGLVARRGRIGYCHEAGFSSLEDRQPIRRDQIFRSASFTKAITATVAMQLVEEGKLNLQDRLADFLPEFSDMKVVADPESEPLKLVPAQEPLTLFHLLTHTSGLSYGWFAPPKVAALYAKARAADLFVPRQESLSDWVKTIAQLPLLFQPGSNWEYGVSYDVLGRVIEIVDGCSLDQSFDRRVLRPLGMADTHFYVPREKLDRLPGLYRADGDARIQRVGNEPVTAEFLTFSADAVHQGKGQFLSAGSGLAMTALDYTRFLQMLLNQGSLNGEQILRPESVQEMQRNQIGQLAINFPDHGDGYGYGFGVLTEKGKAEDGASVGTFSWGGIFNTYYWADPHKEMIGILMVQVFPFFHLDLRPRFKALAYQALAD